MKEERKSHEIFNFRMKIPLHSNFSLTFKEVEKNVENYRQISRHIKSKRRISKENNRYK